jgi:hypothetical protein
LLGGSEVVGNSEVPYSVADPTTSSNLYDDAILILCATSAPDNTGQGENPLKSPCPEPVYGFKDQISTYCAKQDPTRSI